MHRRSLFETLGGLDESLTPHGDRDLVIRYTRENPPLVLECRLADYYIDEKLRNLSFKENLMRD